MLKSKKRNDRTNPEEGLQKNQLALKKIVESYRDDIGRINLNDMLTNATLEVDIERYKLDYNNLVRTTLYMLRRDFDMDTTNSTEAKIVLLIDCIDKLSSIARRRHNFINRMLLDLNMYDTAISSICELASQTNNQSFEISLATKLYEEMVKIGSLDELKY